MLSAWLSGIDDDERKGVQASFSRDRAALLP
jgi:hypothetical protein